MRLPALLLVDVCLWLSLPTVFLRAYYRHTLSGEAIVPHLRLSVALLLALVSLRLLGFLLLRNERARRAVTSVAMALVFAVVASYYALVIIGLESWGRVISWELISSYGYQAAQLADVLGVSLAFVVLAAIAAFAILVAGFWIYIAKADWIPVLGKRASRALSVFYLASAAVVAVIEIYSFLAAPPAARGEPVSLTFFPLEGAWNLQGLAIDAMKAPVLDRAEQAARAAYRAKPAPERRNVILIVSEAFRPDHMSIYGYHRDTTPNLRRLQASGQLRKAPPLRTTCASSACGLFSLGASRFAHEFPSQPITLQEVLKLHGYRVHMILGGDHTMFYNLRKIYGQVDSYYDGYSARKQRYVDEEEYRYMNDDRLVVDRLAGFHAWDGTPVMIQIHLMSTHVLGKREKTAEWFAPSSNYARPENRVLGPGGRPDQALNFYDNGVVQADSTIQRVLEILAAKGYLAAATVAITGDHGEFLGEHGLFQHANGVYEEVLRVPFALVSYGYGPAAPIDGYPHPSQVDIAPTILAELGLPIPRTWSGQPLQLPEKREFTYFREQTEIGLYDHRDPKNFWKYWVELGTSNEFAYNLRLDPAESTNVIDTAPPALRREWRAQVLPAISVGYVPRWEPVKGATPDRGSPADAAGAH
jgi:glucan phosphoethanolaminetransferase (alkaline phosphatase superfamily)